MKYESYIKPMLAKLANAPFDSDDWIFEIKLDGYRAIAELNGNKVKLYSRNGLSFEHDYPSIINALRQMKLHAVIDGEVVALDKAGRSHFQLLQQSGDNPSLHLVYYAFDLLEMNGKNIRKLPLITRKKKLRDILKENDVIRYSDHIEKEGKKIFRLAVQNNLEGIIAKRSASLYTNGTRTGDWQKIKNHNEQEVVIAGFTEPKGSRKFFGSLLLGVYDKGKFIYVGNAGTGFTEKTLKEVYRVMKPLIKNKSPFIERIPGIATATWIKPVLVCMVKFSEWTQGGQMRHPVFLGLRKDKKAKEVIREKI